MSPELKEMIKDGRISVTQMDHRNWMEDEDKPLRSFWNIFKRKAGKKIKSVVLEEENLSKMIDEVMNNFDFEKCQAAMTALDWTWASTTGGIPTIGELQDGALDRILNAIEGLTSKKNKKSKSGYFYSMSGGLKATAWKNKKDEIKYLQLEFILTYWDTE